MVEVGIWNKAIDKLTQILGKNNVYLAWNYYTYEYNLHQPDNSAFTQITKHIRFPTYSAFQGSKNNHSVSLADLIYDSNYAYMLDGSSCELPILVYAATPNLSKTYNTEYQTSWPYIDDPNKIIEPCVNLALVYQIGHLSPQIHDFINDHILTNMNFPCFFAAFSKVYNYQQYLRKVYKIWNQYLLYKIGIQKCANMLKRLFKNVAKSMKDNLQKAAQINQYDFIWLRIADNYEMYESTNFNPSIQTEEVRFQKIIQQTHITSSDFEKLKKQVNYQSTNVFSILHSLWTTQLSISTQVNLAKDFYKLLTNYQFVSKQALHDKLVTQNTIKMFCS